MTNDDVAIDCERQDKQLGQVLRHEVQQHESLADDRHVVQPDTELEIERVDGVNDEKDETVDGQCGDVDRRRVLATHPRHDPDHSR